MNEKKSVNTAPAGVPAAPAKAVPADASSATNSVPAAPKESGNSVPAKDAAPRGQPRTKLPIPNFFKDKFLIGMVSCVVLATLFPDVGKTGGTIHADKLSDLGIALIFFFHGLGISRKNLRDGILSWRIHVCVQATTFIAFPIVAFLFCLVASRFIPDDLVLGFYFLGAIPSTISSSVAMTAAARGNVPAAIFNASLSSILGIFLTPLIVGIFASTATDAATLPIGETFLNLFILLFLPFLIGQIFNPFVYRFVLPYKKYINGFDKLVILLLVFSSFADSVANGLWTNYGAGMLLETFVGTAILLAVALTGTTLVARLLKFKKEDEIATVFCGSKKTLAGGVPMAKLIFGSAPQIGLIVLPIMFYHQLQLLVCTILANRYAARRDDDAA